MEMAESDFVVAYRALNTTEAELLRLELEEAGIAVRIDNELLQSALGEIPIGPNTLPTICVPETQLAEARSIIAADRSLHRQDMDASTRCLACGAEMAESQSQCPECGWTYAVEAQP